MARKRHEQAAARATKHHASRVAVLAGPWLGMVPVFIAGAAFHALWGQSAALPWLTIVGTLIVGLLTWLAVAVSRGRDRSPVAVGHAALTTVGVGGWILTAMIIGVWEWRTEDWNPAILGWVIPAALVVLVVVGLLARSWPLGAGLAALLCVGAYCSSIVQFTHPTIDLWLILAVLVGLSWNIRMAPKAHEEESDPAAIGPGRLGKQLMASLGLEGSNLRVKSHDENRVNGALELAAGEHTVKDAQGVREKLAGAVGVPANRVTMVEDDEDPNLVHTTIMRRDVLKQVVAWPGPSRPGATVFEPYNMGVCSDGSVSEKYVAMREGAEHELQMGTTGSGKTSGSLVEVAEAMSRRESATIVIDFVKGIMNFGCLADGLSKFIIDRKTAEKFFRSLPKVIAARGNFLGARKYKAWEPGCGLTFLTVQVEEASFLVEFDNIDEVAKAARQVGIRLVWSTQRSIHTEMSTTLRAMLTSTTCYGVGDDFDSGILPEEVEAAGADPFKWKNTRRGYHYFVQGGMDVPMQVKAMPRRQYRLFAQEEAAAEGLAGQVLTAEEHARSCNPDPLDQCTVEAFGDWFKNLPSPAEVVAAHTSKYGFLEEEGSTEQMPAPAQGVPAPRDPVNTASQAPAAAAGSQATTGQEDTNMDDDEAIDYEEAVAQDGAEGGVEIEDPAPDMEIDINAEMPESPAELAFGPPESERAPEVSTDELRQMVRARIDEFERNGHESIRPRDFADLYTPPGKVRSHGWFRKEFKRLEQDGRLTYDAESGAWTIQAAAQLAAV